MDEKRVCAHCKRNQAARSYQPMDGSKREFFCLECYDKLFLEVGEEGLDKCPYCDTSLAEVKKSGLVGCAHCYKEMWSGIFPLVQKMQGERAHSGKTPPIDLDDFPAEYREKEITQVRYLRQKAELEIIIEHLHAEGNFEDAKGYEEKLAAMEKRAQVEEDFVWRMR